MASISRMVRQITNGGNYVSCTAIRAISMDVTGTMVSFSGKIEEHYAGAARFCGVKLTSTEVDKIADSFNRAYRETSRVHPCFGNATISAKEWWRACVLRSFHLSGVRMTTDQEERVFQRVYSIFGSHATYEAFPDAKPFLKWAHRHGIIVGVISNADERYGDSILPMLGLSEELSFLCFSKEVGFEKPSQEIYCKALRAAEPWLTLRSQGGTKATPLLPSEVLHIGNDYEKDYVGATEAGFHAVLLDRYGDEQAQKWRRSGAPVFEDLIDVVDFCARQDFRGPYDSYCAVP